MYLVWMEIRADIAGIDKAIHKTDTILMQDDAHGFGIFDPFIPKSSIYMATLGKAAGVMGALLLAIMTL